MSLSVARSTRAINKENLNGEGLNGVARISMLWDRDRAAAEERTGARRSYCGDRQSRRRAGARTPAIRIWSWHGPIWRPVCRRLWISPLP